MADDSLTAQAARLARRLERIPAEIIRHVQPALIQCADRTAQVARSLTPVEEGDLAASIAVTPPGGTTPAYAEGGGRRTAKANQALVTAGGPGVRHGHLMEFGTEPHVNGGLFAGTQHPGTEPQPFILPAARLTEDQNRRRIGRAVAQAIRKVGGSQ